MVYSVAEIVLLHWANRAGRDKSPMINCQSARIVKARSHGSLESI